MLLFMKVMVDPTVENNKESYGRTIYSRHQNRCLQDNNFRQSTATMYGDRSNRLVFVHEGNAGVGRL